jgi:hypothetical protein
VRAGDLIALHPNYAGRFSSQETLSLAFISFATLLLTIRLCLRFKPLKPEVHRNYISK